jgi:hypothetical protein
MGMSMTKAEQLYRRNEQRAFLARLERAMEQRQYFLEGKVRPPSDLTGAYYLLEGYVRALPDE